MARSGQIGETARYCESDVLNTYHVCLAYELLRGARGTINLPFGAASSLASATRYRIRDETDCPFALESSLALWIVPRSRVTLHLL